MDGVSVNRVCPVTLRSHTKVVLLLSTFASDFADRFDLLLSMCNSGLDEATDLSFCISIARLSLSVAQCIPSDLKLLLFPFDVC